MFKWISDWWLNGGETRFKEGLYEFLEQVRTPRWWGRLGYSLAVVFMSASVMFLLIFGLGDAITEYEKLELSGASDWLIRGLLLISPISIIWFGFRLMGGFSSICMCEHFNLHRDGESETS